jgi:hypothetical protein
MKSLSVHNCDCAIDDNDDASTLNSIATRILLFPFFSLVILTTTTTTITTRIVLINMFRTSLLRATRLTNASMARASVIPRFYSSAGGKASSGSNNGLIIAGLVGLAGAGEYNA